MPSDLPARAAAFVAYTRLSPYDQRRWFRRCYASIQRTVHGGRPRATRRELRARLFDGIARLTGVAATQPAFDAWHTALLGDLQTCGKLTLGQAQKLINLMLKYHVAYALAGDDPTWAAERPWVASHGHLFHVPIDVYVLIQLHTRYGYPHVAINDDQTYARLRVGDSTVAWSRLTEAPAYAQIQECIRDCVATQPAYATPLHLEMAELWKKPRG